MTEYNAFLNNQCIEAIVELSRKHKTDMEFGRKVREFINDTSRPDPNQTFLDLDLNHSDDEGN